jgi:hypothetical protein
MLPATPQPTADRRLAAPEPMIEPEITCVVESGYPAARGSENDRGARGLRREALRDVHLDDPGPQRLDDPPTAHERAQGYRAGGGEHDLIRNVERVGGDVAVGDQRERATPGRSSHSPRYSSLNGVTRGNTRAAPSALVHCRQPRRGAGHRGSAMNQLRPSTDYWRPSCGSLVRRGPDSSLPASW